MFLHLRHQRLQSSELDLVIEFALQLLLVARHVGLPPLDDSLQFQERAPYPDG